MSGTTYRFPLQSFLSGMARVLDLTGGAVAYRPQAGLSGPERDAYAMAGDWDRVGGDLCNAMRRVKAHIDHAGRAQGHEPAAQ